MLSWGDKTAFCRGPSITQNSICANGHGAGRKTGEKPFPVFWRGIGQFQVAYPGFQKRAIGQGKPEQALHRILAEGAKLAGKIRKDYYAVVKGEIADSGTIDLPIKRLSESIIKRCVADGGEHAVTHYEPIKTTNKTTLLKINLETGRTHQIRVHFSYLGYPLIGDSLYGGKDNRINRQALHCRDIYFLHPITNEDMHITCPFPQDFQKLI